MSRADGCVVLLRAKGEILGTVEAPDRRLASGKAPGTSLNPRPPAPVKATEVLVFPEGGRHQIMAQSTFRSAF